MIETWEDMKFWESGENQVVTEKLQDLTKKKIAWNPGKKLLYRALDLTPFNKTRVVICGQDPYPDPRHACGLAFSIPREEKSVPPTLKTILTELRLDLHTFEYGHGDLTAWAEQGVLLWNAYPSCLAYQSLSHQWPEWEILTQEMFSNLAQKQIVFVGFGSKARDIINKYVPEGESCVLWTSHPSPRGQINSSRPFIGSRIFSTININLKELGHGTIDWTLK